jgi:hypothetical protein
MLTIMAAPPECSIQKTKAAILNRGFGLNLLESSRSWLIRSPRKSRRSRYSGKPVVAKLPGKVGKSRHKEIFPPCYRERCRVQFVLTIESSWPRSKKHYSRWNQSTVSFPQPELESLPA